MSDDTSKIPQDAYSRALRAARSNPAAQRSESTVHAIDFYGNAETWNIETYRALDAKNRPLVSVFLQLNDAEGGKRFVLPPDVMRALLRQHDQLVSRARKIAARRAVETKRERGVPIGNAAALKRA